MLAINALNTPRKATEGIRKGNMDSSSKVVSLRIPQGKERHKFAIKHHWCVCGGGDLYGNMKVSEKGALGGLRTSRVKRS